MPTRVDDDDDDSYDSNSLLSSSSSEGSSSLPAAQNPWKKHHQPHSSSKPRRGLSKTLQRQLLNDIERNGGILNVSLQALCNKKADIYGSSNSLLRRAVQNKVSRWKKLTKHHYNLVCLELIGTNGTQQESNRKSAETPPPQTNKVTTNRKLVFESPPPSPTNMNNTNKTAMKKAEKVAMYRLLLAASILDQFQRLVASLKALVLPLPLHMDRCTIGVWDHIRKRQRS
jgi:hypothetical protein